MSELETNNVIGNITSVSTDTELVIKSDDSPFHESFYFEEIYDDKLSKQFIKATEKMIRQSREYNSYIRLVRNDLTDLNRDSILGNITEADVELEFHHYPLTLYEIISALMTKHVLDSEKFTSFSIAKEIMELHYKNWIGLVSLTQLTHKLAHSGNVFISKNQIFGQYWKFIEKYKEGIDELTLSRVRQMEELSEKGIPCDIRGWL